MNETPRFPKVPSVAYDKEHMSVVIAVDTSGSVTDHLPHIQQNLNRFKETVCEDSTAAKCVDVCVIQFDDTVRVIQDWCPIQDMKRIELTSGGCTDLNGAVVTAINKVREHSRDYAANGIVEKKPFVIVMTDGFDNITGNVDEAAALATERIQAGKLKLFFLGFGNYDRRSAGQLCEANGRWCFEVEDGCFDFTEFFDYVGNSVKAVSVSAPGEEVHVETTMGTEGSKIKLTPLDRWLNN